MDKLPVPTASSAAKELLPLAPTPRFWHQRKEKRGCKTHQSKLVFAKPGVGTPVLARKIKKMSLRV